MKKFLTALLTFAASLVAACPADRACLSWTAPTRNVDNSPIRLPITYRVYRIGSPIVLVGTTQAQSFVVTQQPSGQQCFVVTANTIGGESEFSNQACKFLRPSAPTDGAIEALSNGAIEVR
jgi:hypothetical protein